MAEVKAVNNEGRKEATATKSKLKCLKVIEYLKGKPKGDTKTAIKEAVKVNSGTIEALLECLLEDEQIEPVEVIKGNTLRNGFKIREGGKVDEVDDEDDF